MPNQPRFVKKYTDDWEEPLPDSPPGIEADGQAPDGEPIGVENGEGPPIAVAAAKIGQSAAASIALPEFALGAGFPVLFARSSIFRANGDGSPMAFGPIECYPPYGCEFEGPRLSMRDKAVWEAVVAEAREAGFAGAELSISLSALCRAVGGSGNGAGLRAVAASLGRLALARVRYALGDGNVHECRLLGSARADGARWLASLDPGLLPALTRDLSFPIDARRRAKMKSELAMWLHDFLSTHERFDKGFKLGHLAKLAGYEGPAGALAGFVRKAMGELVVGAPEVAKSYAIKRAGHSSAGWRLGVEPGTEKPKFAMPRERHAAKAAVARGAPSQAKRPGHRGAPAKPRGGVAL